MKKYIKTLTVKVFAPENKISKTNRFFAGMKKAWSEDGINEVLGKMAEDLEKLYPGHEYRLVQIAADTFNFVWHSGSLEFCLAKQVAQMPELCPAVDQSQP